MHRLVAEGSECVLGGITRDAFAHQQLQFELSIEENVGKAPATHPAPVLAWVLTERTPFPRRPSFPLISYGITAQVSTASHPPEIGTVFDFGDLAIATSFARLELVICGLLYTLHYESAPRLFLWDVPRLVALKH